MTAQPPSAQRPPESAPPPDAPRYLTGFGNHLASEAVPGALPPRQNGPREVPFGLYAEQINGTGFTVHRAHNLRTWLYRLRPQVSAQPFVAIDGPPRFVGRFGPDVGVASPEPQRYRPAPLPGEGVDLLAGVQTFAGAGDPAVKRGVAFHLFAATADMTRVFCNIDGDLLIAPHQGTLQVQTELGWLHVAPTELALIPRGLRFRVLLPDGRAQGFMAELFDGHFQLPERGPVGANGLADERHFKAPVAWYEDRATPTDVVVKQGGRFWQTTLSHSPFDVVAWHGRYVPFKYDLRDFNSFGSVSWDHPDPSLLTVLTSPMDTHGRNAVDVAAFVGRWDVTEDTFRPPFFHRNAAVEFNMVLQSPTQGGAYPTGAFSFTPYLTPHGVSARGYEAAVHNPAAVENRPVRGSDRSVWLQFESTYALAVMPWFFDARDSDFLAGFSGFSVGALGQGPARDPHDAP